LPEDWLLGLGEEMLPTISLRVSESKKDKRRKTKEKRENTSKKSVISVETGIYFDISPNITHSPCGHLLLYKGRIRASRIPPIF